MNEPSPLSKNRLTSVFFALFSAVPLALVFYVFYEMDVRSRLEDLLFDLRTKLKPQQADTSRLAIVTIGQSDLNALEGENVSQPSMASILQIVAAVERSQPEAIGLVLPHHDLDYDSSEFLELLAEVEKNPHLYIGTFDYNFNEPTDVVIPSPLAFHPERMLGCDTLRKYKREVIRALPLISFQAASLRLHLTSQLALEHSTGEKHQALVALLDEQVSYYRAHARANRSVWHPFPLPSTKLNYFLPPTFLALKASQLVARSLDTRLAGRIVLIGYTAFRKRDFVFREGTHVATPWEGDMTPEIFGFPLIYVLAIQLQNLLEASWLRESGWALIALQSLGGCLVSFFAWQLAPFLAVSLVVVALFLLFYLHGWLFTYANLLIPLADTMLFTVLATIGGAFRRAHADSHKRALRELSAKSQRQLARIQAHFLNRFSFELCELNRLVVRLLSRNLQGFAEGSTLAKVMQKAISSGEELADYLAGIKHYARFAETDSYQVKKTALPLAPLMAKVVDQFDSLVAASALEVLVEIPGEARIWTDELLFEPIIFNLVSNAIKYSPSCGRVHIRVVEESPTRLCISIRDLGPGIPPELQAKIFEKFYRIKNDQVYQIKGNGLGLYLARYFADKIDAELWVISTPEEAAGADFRIRVERART